MLSSDRWLLMRKALQNAAVRCKAQEFESRGMVVTFRQRCEVRMGSIDHE